MKRVNESSVRTGSNNHLVGGKIMKKNRSVYLVYGDCWMTDIDYVFASMKAVKMYLEKVKDRILHFMRSDKAYVTIEKRDPDEDGMSWCVQSNVPGYGPVVCKAEVEDSQSKKLSEIQHVWVVWSEVDPYGHTVHLTEQAVKEHLKSMDWMDDKGNIKDDIVVQYKEFKVVNSSHVKSK